jgi:hypothetical protein
VAARRTSAPKPKANRRSPATTPEARENQLIALAQDLVEQRIRDGSASAQETVHYLKLGSSREKLEQKKMENENKLTEAKIDALASATNVEALYKEAMENFSLYAGREPTGPSDEYDG